MGDTNNNIGSRGPAPLPVWKSSSASLLASKISSIITQYHPSSHLTLKSQLTVAIPRHLLASVYWHRCTNGVLKSWFSAHAQKWCWCIAQVPTPFFIERSCEERKYFQYTWNTGIWLGHMKNMCWVRLSTPASVSSATSQTFGTWSWLPFPSLVVLFTLCY